MRLRIGAVAVLAVVAALAGASSAAAGAGDTGTHEVGHFTGKVRGITWLRTTDGTTGTLSLQLQGLSAATHHRLVWASGDCATPYQRDRRLTGLTIRTAGRPTTFRKRITMDVSGLSFDTWDNGSLWVLKGRTGTRALGCTTTQLSHAATLTAVSWQPAVVLADATVAVVSGPDGKGLVSVRQLPGDQLRVRTALQGLPAGTRFRIRGSSATSCGGPYDPGLDDVRLGGTTTSAGNAWVIVKVPGKLEYPNLATAWLGLGGGSFVPVNCAATDYLLDIDG